jgi:Tfp pilus assembly protein PilN
MSGEAASDQGRRAWLGPLAILALLGLLLVVALASAGGGPGIGETAPGVKAPTILSDYLASLALMLVPLGAALFVASMVLRRERRARMGGKKRSLLPMTLLVGIAVGILLVVGAELRIRGDETGDRRTPTATTPTQTATTETEQEQARPYDARFQWLPYFMLGTLVFAFAATAAGLAIRRRLRPPDPNAVLAAELSAALAETLDDLEREPDPRKAVIGAYARMERTLAAKGLPRHDSETPLEYLERALDVVQAGGHSARRLTRLFERARFSPHTIDERMKQDAIAALVAVRTELEAER